MASTLTTGVGPVVLFVAVLLVGVESVGSRRRGSAEFALKCVQIGDMGAVLQLAGDFLLLCLRTAAPHGTTPSLARSSGGQDLGPRAGKVVMSCSKRTSQVRPIARGTAMS